MIEDRRALRAQARAVARDRRRQLPGMAGPQGNERLLLRTRQQFRFLIAVGGKHVEARHYIRLGQHRRRPEGAAINVDRRHQRIGREVRGEGIRQAQHRSELRAERARSQDPQGHIRPCPRRGADAGLAIVGEIALQLDHILRKGIGVAVEIAAHRARDDLVRARSAAEPQVDPPGKQRVERAELFGNGERRMVGQHDPARADADGGGRIADMRQHHRCRRAGDAGHAVMLGGPIARKAEPFDMRCNVGGIGQGLRHTAAFNDGDEIEQGIVGHKRDVGRPARSRHPFPFALSSPAKAGAQEWSGIRDAHRSTTYRSRLGPGLRRGSKDRKTGSVARLAPPALPA
ncbi:hypothetical protein D9M73_106960 [compost metagenome]